MTVSFNKFRRMVDSAICAKVGLGIDDLEDTLLLEDYWEEDEDLDIEEWRDMARECASEILANSGYNEDGMED